MPPSSLLFVNEGTWILVCGRKCSLRYRHTHAHLFLAFYLTMTARHFSRIRWLHSPSPSTQNTRLWWSVYHPCSPSSPSPTGVFTPPARLPVIAFLASLPLRRYHTNSHSAHTFVITVFTRYHTNCRLPFTPIDKQCRRETMWRHWTTLQGRSTMRCRQMSEPHWATRNNSRSMMACTRQDRLWKWTTLAGSLFCCWRRMSLLVVDMLTSMMFKSGSRINMTLIGTIKKNRVLFCGDFFFFGLREKAWTPPSGTKRGKQKNTFETTFWK